MSVLTEQPAARVGTALPAATFPITRKSLVRYAGASGDFNEIHWNGRFAREIGLPDVVAHGMYTMALAARVLTDWAGGPAAVREFTVRFANPVVVPDDAAGTELTVRGQVTRELGGGLVRVDLEVAQGGTKVLSRAFAVVHAPDQDAAAIA